MMRIHLTTLAMAALFSSQVFAQAGECETACDATLASGEACSAETSGEIPAEAVANRTSSGSCPVIGSQYLAEGQATTAAAGSGGSASCEPGSGCAPTDSLDGATCEADATIETGLDEESLGKVVEHIGALIELARQGDGRLALDFEAIQQETGVTITMKNSGGILAAVSERLDVNFKSGGSRCSDYEACSLYGDLGSATDETLAVHCSHSFDSYDVLHQLAHEYEPQGLRVVGLLINSGSAEDANYSLQGIEACYDIWVSEGDAAGKALASRLVPSQLLLDSEGRIVKKFVGYHDVDDLRASIEDLLQS